MSSFTQPQKVRRDIQCVTNVWGVSVVHERDQH